VEKVLLSVKVKTTNIKNISQNIVGIKVFFMARKNNSGKKVQIQKHSKVKQGKSQVRIKNAKTKIHGTKLHGAKVVKKIPIKATAKRVKKQQYTLQKTLLTSAAVRTYLIGAAGENTINVLREFTCELSDEELAKKAKMKVSDVRIVLNKLHNMGMAQYARSRDKDSGWYSYVWHIDEGKEKDILMPVYKNSLPQGEEGEVCIVEGEGDKYFCSGCGSSSVVDFGTAMDRQFKRAGCGCDLSFWEKKKIDF